MTLPVGTLVKIKDSSQYFTKYRQGVIDGVKVIGIVIEEAQLRSWDVKVHWPYHKQNAYAYYSSQRDLEAVPALKKNLSGFL